VKRADVLRDGALLRHDENVFLRERLAGGQTVGNFNGHM
jgi:hypothetical protein